MYQSNANSGVFNIDFSLNPSFREKLVDFHQKGEILRHCTAIDAEGEVVDSRLPVEGFPFTDCLHHVTLCFLHLSPFDVQIALFQSKNLAYE